MLIVISISDDDGGGDGDDKLIHGMDKQVTQLLQRDRAAGWRHIEATYDVHLGLIEKLVDSLLVIIELFR